MSVTTTAIWALAGMRAIALVPLWLYRHLVSPLLPRVCRYYPSCSAYAEEAVQLHGIGRGGALALRRLLRCHPWTPGGVDHVPGHVGREPSTSTLTGA